MNCPITRIFTAGNSLSEEVRNNPEYTVLDYLDEHLGASLEARYLIYSKKYDNLPLIRLTLGLMPCLDPNADQSYG